MKWKIIAAIGFIIGIIIGFGFGYEKGTKDTIHLGINIALALIDKNKLNIEIDAEMIEKAWFQYQNQVSSCLFFGNESIS